MSGIPIPEPATSRDRAFEREVTENYSKITCTCETHRLRLIGRSWARFLAQGAAARRLMLASSRAR